MQQIKNVLERMLSSQNTSSVTHFSRDTVIIGFWFLLGAGLSYWGVNTIMVVRERFVAGWYTPEVNIQGWISDSPEVALSQLSASALVIALSAYMAIRIIWAFTHKLNGVYKDVCVADLAANIILGNLSIAFKVVVYIGGFAVCVFLTVYYYASVYDSLKNPDIAGQYGYPFIGVDLDEHFALIMLWLSIGTLAGYGAIRIVIAGIVRIAKFAVAKIEREN